VDLSAMAITAGDYEIASDVRILDYDKEVLFTDENGFVFFEYADGKYKLYDYVGTQTEITIPATYNNGNVTGIRQYAFYNKTNITKVIIPEGVTSIGNNAFSGCTSLIEITMPESLLEIGENSFCDCTSLMVVDVPKNVESIGINGFSNCISLTNITFGRNLKTIGKTAFWACHALKSVTFKNTEGWSVSNWGSSTSIASNDLVNSTTAAMYLTSTYSSYDWQCTIS